MAKRVKTAPKPKVQEAVMAGSVAGLKPEMFAEALAAEGGPLSVEDVASEAEKPARVPFDPSTMKEKATVTPEAVSIAESREALKHPLPQGMQFFESPEGYIVVAEAGRGHIWCRQANGGKGSLINPRR